MKNLSDWDSCLPEGYNLKNNEIKHQICDFWADKAKQLLKVLRLCANFYSERLNLTCNKLENVTLTFKKTKFETEKKNW